MRTLNPNFIIEFKSGKYKRLIDKVITDSDLDFQIRENYVNIYYKGNSILKLWENSTFEIHQKFVKNTSLPEKGTFLINDFLSALPKIKENVNEVKSKRPTLEIEYEQLFIRSNNTVNSELFITDRQFADKEDGADIRFDLTGITWSQPRKRGQTVPLTFVEVKYGLNNDIKNLSNQLQRYYDKVKSKVNDIVKETQSLLDLKADLGLFGYKGPSALQSLTVSNTIEHAIFIIALIDYNPNSKLFDIDNITSLSFSNQIRIFYCGFSIWDQYLKEL
ncbi:MAG: hypothetical protein U0W24_10120 [Bacteroidales bacterium]